MSKTATQKEAKLLYLQNLTMNKEAILGSEAVQSVLERKVDELENIRNKGLYGGSWQNIKDYGTGAKGWLTGDLPLTRLGSNAYEREKAFWDAHKKKLAEEERRAQLQTGDNIQPNIPIDKIAKLLYLQNRPEILEEATAMDKEAAFGFTTAGAGIGGLVGAMREKEKGEDRLKAILRSMFTGAATGLGADVGVPAGALVGGAAGALPGLGVLGAGALAGDEELGLTGLGLTGAGGITGALAGGLGGGILGAYGAHQLAKRKDEQLMEEEENPFMEGYDYKEASSMNKNAILGSTAIGAGLGGLVGAVREKEEDESRIDAILRSMLTGGAVGAGGGAGRKIGGKLGRIKGGSPISGIIGGAVGETAGQLGAFQIARRKPKRKDKSEKETPEMNKDAILRPIGAGALNIGKKYIDLLKGTKVLALQKQIANKQQAIKDFRSSWDIKKYRPTLEKRILAEQAKLRKAALMSAGTIGATTAAPIGAYMALKGGDDEIGMMTKDANVVSWSEFITKHG